MTTPSSDIDFGDPTSPPPISLGRSLLLGAISGFRSIAFIVIPTTVFAITMSLLPTAVGLGAGHGFSLQDGVLYATGFFLFMEGLAVLLGAAFGLVSFVSGGKLSNRKISLFRRREAEEVETPETLQGELPAYSGSRRLFRVLVAAVSMQFILGVGYIAGIFIGKSVDNRLARAFAEADRDDPHWRFDDLVENREPVPDDENSAFILEEVNLMLPDEGWPPVQARLPGGPNRPTTELSEAVKRLEATESQVQLDDQTLAILRNGLAEHTEAIKLARSTVDFRRGHHELDYPSNLLNTLLPETQKSRSTARLLNAFAAIQAQDGDINGSLETSRAIFAIGRSTGDEPFLISQLVRLVIGKVAMRSAHRALGYGEASDETLAKLQNVILDELAQPLLAIGMRGERAALDEMNRRIRDGEASLDKNESPEDIRPLPSWFQISFDYQRAVGLEWLNALVDIAVHPPYERPALIKKWDAEYQRVSTSSIERRLTFFPLLMTPAWKLSEQAHSFYQSELGAMAILIASERQRLKTGRWPATIAEIDPKFLKQVPVDPFTGRPYLLERINDRFIIHSIGPNLRDEHGAYDYSRRRGQPDDVGATAWDVPSRKQAAPPRIEEEGEEDKNKAEPPG